MWTTLNSEPKSLIGQAANLTSMSCQAWLDEQALDNVQNNLVRWQCE